MVRRTKEDALATREGLLDAAEQLFLSRGVARTSLQDIASAAGLTRGAVYWHFEDKAALFDAMMDRGILPCEDAALACTAGADAAQPLATLRQLALAPLQHTAHDARTQRLFTIAIHRTEYSHELAALRERYQRCTEDYIDRIERLLMQAQQQGQLRAQVAPRAAAIGLSGLVDGLLRYATLAPGNLAALRQADVAIDVYLAGLRASP